jgi:tetratricopeptide (TPR) repeat protein
MYKDINTSDLHEEAMHVAESALVYHKRGQQEEATACFSRAYELEKQAVFASKSIPEPTRSVLLRSAASLAFHARRYRESEKMVNLALAGDPPAEIADELRDLAEQLYQHRPPVAEPGIEDPDLQAFEVTGRLAFADDSCKNIQLSDERGQKLPYFIRVSENFDRLVRDYWKERIYVRGLRHPNSNRVLLIEVRRVG